MKKNQISAIAWAIRMLGLIIFLIAIFTDALSFGWGLVILIALGILSTFIHKFFNVPKNK